MENQNKNKISKKLILVAVGIILTLFILFNISYKMIVGTDCCSCCDDSQEVCISACCRCTFTEKIEKLVKVLNK